MIYVAAYRVGETVHRRQFVSESKEVADIVLDAVESIGVYAVCQVTDLWGTSIWREHEDN